MSKQKKVVSIAAGGHRARVLARRDALVEAHLDLVPPMARQIAAFLPPSFELDDLISAGNLGLLQAATRYRPKEHGNTPFSAYARPVIRGAMLDSVKRSSWRNATGAPLEDAPEPSVVVAIDESIDERRRRARIDSAIGDLSERHQRVIGLHYDGELGLAAVGERLGVGASRASQLHMEAVRTLRGSLRGV